MKHIKKKTKIKNDKKKDGKLSLRKMKLATKLALIISVLLTIVFAALLVFTLVSVQKSTGGAISEEFNAMSKSNGLQVQNIIDDATSVSNDMNSYFENVYKLDTENKVVEQTSIPVEYTGHMSSIYNKKISDLNSDIEKYITETARNTVENNSNIAGMGVMLEPYKFGLHFKDYAFYIGESDVNSKIKPFGKYSEYSKKEYYAKAIQEKRLVFTEPYEYNGITMITAATPIIYQNSTIGIIMVDMNVDNFEKIDSKNKSYPSMFSVIYDDKGFIIYDSESKDNTGKNMSEFYSDQEQLTDVQSQFAKGEAFNVETKMVDGRKVTRFYNPIKSGDKNWWTVTAVKTDDMNKSVHKITIFVLIMSVLSLILIVAAVVVVLKRMLKPIEEIVDAAKNIAKGNFDVTLEVKSNDEIGVLSKTFDDMAKYLKTIIIDISYVLDNIANKNLDVHTSVEYVGDMKQIKDSMDNIITSLNDVIGDMNQSADQVADGTEQVSSGAQALSQGATEQASSIEELSASIDEISEQVSKNAENANTASKESSIAAIEIHEGNNHMQEMIKAINEISDKSGEISKIIKTIDDIAFQTNILALNAAVEAARAGSAGKGFAVVADEVRNLASKSAEAAKNTTILIEDTVKAVENGTEIAEKTAKSMLVVVESAKKVTNLVDEIAEASSNQAVSIEQVTVGVEQISSVVQTNSATAEESAAASEELSGQAEMLKGMVNQFKLKNSENNVMALAEDEN